MSVFKKLAPIALSAGLFALVGGAAVAAATSPQGQPDTGTRLVQPASVVTPESATPTTVATATTQEEPVQPEPTTTPEATAPTTPAGGATSKPSPKPSPKNVDPATIPHEDYAPDDPRRQERPPVAERYNSTGAENGIVVPLPGQTAEPRPDSPTPTATTSTQP